MADPVLITIDTSEILAEAVRIGATSEVIADEMRATMIMSLDTIEGAVKARTPVGVTGAARASIYTDVKAVSLTGQAIDLEGVIAAPEAGSPIPYIMALEEGLEPGQAHPGTQMVSSLELWAIRKLGVSAANARGVAWAIAKKIEAKGTKGAHMFRDGLVATRDSIEQFWALFPKRVADRMNNQ